MGYPAPVYLIVVPVLAAVLALLVSRWQRATAVTGFIAVLFLGWLTRSIVLEPGQALPEAPLFAGDTWEITGRTLTLSPGVQALILYICLGLGVLYLLTLLWPQGKTFIPASLLALSSLAVALMITPFVFGAPFLAVALGLVMMAYHPQILRRTYGGLRYIALVIVAVTLLLVVGWMLSAGRPLGSTATILSMLVAAILVFMAGFPLHIWVGATAREMPLLLLPILFGLVQTAVLAFLFTALQENLALMRNPQFVQWVQLSGMGTILAASLLAVTAVTWRELLAYLLLLNMGLGVLALALPFEAAWQTSILLHISRFLSLLLAVVGLSFMQKNNLPEKMQASSSIGRQFPFSTALFLLGAFALIGLPLTIGFPGLWALLAAGGDAPAWLPVLIMVGLAGGVAALLRAVSHLWAVAQLSMGVEPRWMRAVAGAVGVIAFLLALYPRPIIIYAGQLAAAFLQSWP